MDENRSIDGVRRAPSPASQSPQVAEVAPAPAGSDTVPPNPPSSPLAQPTTFTTPIYQPQARRVGFRWTFVALGAGLIALLGVGFMFITRAGNTNAQVVSGEYNTVQVPLGNVSSSTLTADAAKTLKINGQLQVSNSLVLTPTAQPASPITGQIYYDKASNQLAFYNGQQFQNLGGGSTTTTNTTNVIGTATTPNSVLLQDTAPGTGQSGNFNISGTGKVGTLQTSVISSNGSSLFINPTSISTEAQPEGVATNLGKSDTSGTPESSPGWQNGLNAQKVTMGDVGGKLQSMSVHFIGGSSSNHVQFAVYEDDGDVPSKPGALVTSSAVVNLTPDGWTTASLPAVTLSPNTTYWLAVNTDDATVKRIQSGGSQNYCYVFKSFGTMTDPFSAPGCFIGDLTYPLYATFLTSGGAAGSVSQAHLTIGTDGATLLRNSEDNSNAFQVQNAAGTNTIFNVDTINNRVAIGKANASYKLDIAGGDINLGNGHSLRFGGLQTLTVTSGGITALSNLSGGGTVRIQGDTFTVNNRDASHTNMAINNTTGATTFTNATNSTTAFQVQNTSSSSILTVDTTNSIVTVTALVVTGNITVNGHLVTGGSAPGIAAGAAACTAPTVVVSGTDTSGTITVTTGTGCATGGVLATLTFANAFAAAPHITLTPGNASSQTLGAYTDNSAVSTTQFTLNTASTATDATTYEWNYLAVQ